MYGCNKGQINKQIMLQTQCLQETPRKKKKKQSLSMTVSCILTSLQPNAEMQPQLIELRRADLP